MASKGKIINVPSTSKADRKRGRPVGKNRAPLSLEERRARNAKYEKERRVEMAAAMADLADAAGCNPQITNTELLAQVINRLQSVPQKKNIQEIKTINDNLVQQIDILTRRIKEDPNLCHNLGTDSEPDTDDSSSSESEDDSSDEAAMRSESESSSVEEGRPAKILKTEECSSISDYIQENINARTSTVEDIKPFTEFSFMTLFETDGDLLEEATCSASTFFQSMELSEG